MLSRARFLGLLLVPLLAYAAAQAQQPKANGSDVVKRGEYLARAGDCVACHTAPERQARSPAAARCRRRSATSTSPNITPDDETGIGQWTADEFYRMMHTGVSRDGDAALSGDAVRVLHQGHARRLRRDLRLPHVGAAGEAEEPAARAALPVQQARAAGRLAHAVLQGGRVRAGPEASRRNGTAAPTWCEGLGHCAMCHTADQRARRLERVARRSKAG